MKKVVTVLAALLLLSGPVQAKYCTTKNWDTGKNLYKKYEAKYNQQVDDFNDVLDTYNAFEFFSKTYSVNAFSKIWSMEQQAIDAVRMQKELAHAEVEKFDQIKDKITAIAKGLDKSRRLWLKLADYCYDEDNYNSYKAGRNNMRDAISTLKDARELIERINGLRLKYLQEVGFINQSQELYEQGCDCKVSI